MTSKTLSTQTDLLKELLDTEHGGCEDTTCAMSHCMSHGYYLWAFNLFANSGAASEKFMSIYNKLPKKEFDREAEKERAEFCKEVPSVACPHCDAMVYEPEQCDYHCSSCGERATFEVRAQVCLPDGVEEPENDGWHEGFKVLSAELVTANLTVFKVAMKYGKSPEQLTRQIMEVSIGAEMPKGTLIHLRTGEKVA